MFKLRNLFTLGFILVMGILVYNYFLGDETEQAQAKTTFQTIGNAVKEVGSAVGTLLKSEKEKYDEGKYDQAVDKISGLFNDLKGKAENFGDKSEEYLENLKELNKQKEALQDKINGLKGKEMSDEESTEVNEDMKEDLTNINEIVKRIERMAKEEESKGGE